MSNTSQEKMMSDFELSASGNVAEDNAIWVRFLAILETHGQDAGTVFTAIAVLKKHRPAVLKQARTLYYNLANAFK